MPSGGDPAQQRERLQVDVDAAVRDRPHRPGVDRDQVAAGPARREMRLVGGERERERRVRAPGREREPVGDEEAADGGRRRRRPVADRERRPACARRAARPGARGRDRRRPGSASSAAPACRRSELHRPGLRPHRHEHGRPRRRGARAPAPTPDRRSASSGARGPKRVCSGAAQPAPSGRRRRRAAGPARARSVSDVTGRPTAPGHPAAPCPRARRPERAQPSPRHTRCTQMRPRRPRPRPETPSRKAYARANPRSAAVSWPQSDDASRVGPLGGSLWGTPRGTGVTTHRIACASLRLRRRSAHAGQEQSGRVVGRRLRERLEPGGAGCRRGRPPRRPSWTETGQPAAMARGRRRRSDAGRAGSRRRRRGRGDLPRPPCDRPRELTAVIERALHRLDDAGPAATAAAGMSRRRSSRRRWGGCPGRCPRSTRRPAWPRRSTCTRASSPGSPTAAGSSGAPPTRDCATTATAGWPGPRRRRG